MIHAINKKKIQLSPHYTKHQFLEYNFMFLLLYNTFELKSKIIYSFFYSKFLVKLVHIILPNVWGISRMDCDSKTDANEWEFKSVEYNMNRTYLERSTEKIYQDKNKVWDDHVCTLHLGTSLKMVINIQLFANHSCISGIY